MIPLQRKRTDERIEEAIEAGTRNQATLQLVYNWCRHARIQRSGVGMVEQLTALPIGAIGLACDHAAARGILSFDLAHAAVDFYDRNCTGCRHRLPVGLPNIATLVAERDARQQRDDDERRARHTELLARREKRAAERQQLRERLPWDSQRILDDLAELDRDPTQDAIAKGLVETSKLAPETFAPELIEHLFTQLENGENWFADCGLRMLQQLTVKPTRLVGCAMHCLSRGYPVVSAAQVVELHAVLIDPVHIPDALPALADLANPESVPLSPRAEPQPGPLRAVHQAHRASLEAGIEALLSQRNPYHVSLAAGALEVLSRTDRAILRRFTRSLAAKLNGASHLIDRRDTGFSGDDECINRLKSALTLALRYAPDDTDACLTDFLAGARAESEVRLYQVYAGVLRGGRRRSHRGEDAQPAASVALKRLLGALRSTNPEVLREIQSALAYSADEHVALARREFSTLLGSAIVLDDVLREFDAETPTQQTFFERLERRNQRALWEHIQENLLKWAATASHGSPLHTVQYVEVMANLPPERKSLRSAFITEAKHFIGTPDGLNTMLPALYTAMVGTCVLSRGAAATLLGELNRRGLEDLPELVYEAFGALLADPYVWVHRSAVRALRNFNLPKERVRQGKAVLSSWILYYSANAKDDSDSFLVELIRLYWRRYALPTEKGFLTEFYVQALERMRPYQATGELSHLRRELTEAESFAKLIIRLLSEPELVEHQIEEVLDSLAILSQQQVLHHRTRLAEVASSEKASPNLATRVAEILTHVGAWQEAALITEAFYRRIHDTTERHPLKLRANLWRIATKFEETLSQGDLDSALELTRQWRATDQEIEEDRLRHAKQRSLIPGFPLAQ